LAIVAIMALFNGVNAIWLCVTFVSWFLSYVVGEGIFYHRYFTHGAFKCKSWVAKVGGTLGMFMAVGSPLSFKVTHLAHHAQSDTENDPHSPKQGFFNAFLFWQLDDKKNHPPLTSVLRLLTDPYYKFLALNSVKIWWIPVIITVLIDWRITVFMCLGGCIGWIFTCITNSFCHAFGSRRFVTKDNSRNIWWLSWLCWQGSGALQNNHHAYPKRKYDSHAWYEFDIGKYLIPIFEKI